MKKINSITGTALLIFACLVPIIGLHYYDYAWGGRGGDGHAVAMTFSIALLTIVLGILGLRSITMSEK